MPTIFIQTPSKQQAQQLPFLSYKNHNTLKALVAATPSEGICFMSDLYGGNISDQESTKQEACSTFWSQVTQQWLTVALR